MAMKILLIVPAYNEEENILKVRNIIENYNEKSEQKLDYIIINDGSQFRNWWSCSNRI